MGRKKNEKLDFRFYDIPVGSSALTLLGDAWVGVYGQPGECLHFHNLFEIGYCHFGRGKLLLGDREQPYEDAMISAIPANYPHATFSEGTDSWEFLFFDPREIVQEMYPGNPGLQEEMLMIAAKRPNLLRIDEYPELASTVWQILEEARRKRRYCQDAIRGLLRVCLLELIRIQEGMNAEGSWPDRSQELLLQISPALSYIETQNAQNLRVTDLAGRCGVRWIRVTDRRGRGMEFFGDELYVNVLPYTPHELENAAHAYELPPACRTVVRVALRQMGVGGDDSWGARTHPEYLLPAEQDLVLRFGFRGV